MEETIEARVAPEKVWALWEKKIEEPVTGKIRYKILNVQKGKSFSILWKTLFVRLIFTHSVKKAPLGSFIRYQVEIKGLFAMPVRFFLGEKIRQNLSLVLRSVVRDLENQTVK
jgi:hypothetical protein